MKDNQIPPQLFLKIFRWYCHPKTQDYIEGDLMEVYERRVKEFGKRKADIRFIIDVVLLFRPGIIRPTEGYENLNNYGMIKSYFRIGIRNLLKSKGYSAINIGGLAVGLASFIIIMLYVQHEFSYDRFYKNADRIYRVYQKQPANVYLGSDYFAVTPAPLASVLEAECPEVVNATSVKEGSALLGIADQRFWERGMAGDSHFFEVFAFPFIQGNPKFALKDPKSIVLTKSLATKIFGPEDPVGQSLNYQNKEPYTVTGVINDPPSNSSFQFSYIVNILSNEWYGEQIKKSTFNNNSFHTFFVLAEGANPQELEKKFPALLEKYRDPKEYAEHPFKAEFLIQELTAMYLSSAMNFEIGLKGNQQYVYLFSAVALIVLLLACVNYMNLAIARSIKRAREVGLRKVVGAVRSQITVQFLGESILIAFLSLLLAIAISYLLLPVFGSLMERSIELNFIQNKLLIPGLLLLVILVGLFSGSYPAFVMSSLRPIQVLKGKMDGKLSGFRLQRWLIVAQYAASIALIIGSFVIYQQLDYIRHKPLGYDKQNVLVIQAREYSNYEALYNEWKNHPGVISITSSGNLPTNVTSSTIINQKEGSDKIGLAIYEFYVDYDFLSGFGIKLIAGRSFSRDIKSDNDEGYVINETAAKALGWKPEEAIGKQFNRDLDGVKTVIGVVKDFHMHSMHLPIEPLMISLRPNQSGYISIKLRPENLPETIAYVEASAKKYSPYPFEYQFLEDYFNQLYQSETKLGEIFGFFTVVSILIASLGLFGLAAFASDQRAKEIGIRKVLGASTKSIVMLLSKNFLSLIILAFIISIPIAWYGMDKWLQDFAYRIELEWWMFVGAGFLALFIANLAISYQSIKAGLANPVTSLRSE